MAARVKNFGALLVRTGRTAFVFELKPLLYTKSDATRITKFSAAEATITVRVMEDVQKGLLLVPLYPHG